MNFDILNPRIMQAYPPRLKLRWTFTDLPKGPCVKLTAWKRKGRKQVTPCRQLTAEKREARKVCLHLAQVQFLCPKSPVRYIVLSGGDRVGQS